MPTHPTSEEKTRESERQEVSVLTTSTPDRPPIAPGSDKYPVALATAARSLPVSQTQASLLCVYYGLRAHSVRTLLILHRRVLACPIGRCPSPESVSKSVHRAHRSILNSRPTHRPSAQPLSPPEGGRLCDLSNDKGGGTSGQISSSTNPRSVVLATNSPGRACWLPRPLRPLRPPLRMEREWDSHVPVNISMDESHDLFGSACLAPRPPWHGMASRSLALLISCIFLLYRQHYIYAFAVVTCAPSPVSV